MIKYIILLIILISMSISDIKNFEIKNNQLLFLLLISLTFIKKENILFVFSFCLLLFVIGIFSQKYIGGGDIKIFILLTIIFDVNIIYIFLFSSSSALIYCYCFNKKKVPFVPFILLSTIFTILIINFNIF